MPWKCPACSTQIEHSEAAIQPVNGALYRCSVCRLELIFDAAINKLTVAPFVRDESNQKTRPTN
jgi:rubredoxin